MFILTSHNKLIAVNQQSELVQTEKIGEPGTKLVTVPFVTENRAFDDGPLANFKIIRSDTGVNFVKNGQFLSAEPHNRSLLANRRSAREWETFTLIPVDQDLETVLAFNRSIPSEIERFRKKVERLIALGQPVKIYCGCGPIPREGFLNLDITVMARGFAIEHSDDYFIFPYADMAWGIDANTVDYIFHEDFIEHISQLQQIQFLAESLRVLKPGCYHRVNTPNIIAAMKRHSDFSQGYEGVYKGETQWGHICIFSPASLKEMAELVGYREVVFTTKSHGVSPYAENDVRPVYDRDQITGNIYADLQK